MRKTWKPTVAGILDVISSVGFLGYIIAAYFGYEDKSFLAFTWLPLTIPALVGGICALRRRIWWLALAGSVLSLPPLNTEVK